MIFVVVEFPIFIVKGIQLSLDAFCVVCNVAFFKAYLGPPLFPSISIDLQLALYLEFIFVGV